jgi:O-antigen biosynthesis protein
MSDTGFNPLDFPLCWSFPDRLSRRPASAWIEHIPFAFALVEILRPACIVELGVFAGDSFLSFCQAVKALGLDARCYGVDHWRSDEHAGPFGPEVLDSLRRYHDPRYGSFSRLVESTFDEAAPSFPDGSVDLLHIDGYHTYEQSRHDFETWQPKLSSRAVVVFHDTNVRERGFGVGLLWQELAARFPHFEFTHGHGLGVLLHGAEAPAPARRLAALGGADAEKVREFYFRLGHQLLLARDSEQFDEELIRIRAALADSRQAAADSDRNLADCRRELENSRHELHDCRQELDSYRQERDRWSNELALIKASRFWRLREFLIALPGLKQLSDRRGE